MSPTVPIEEPHLTPHFCFSQSALRGKSPPPSLPTPTTLPVSSIAHAHTQLPLDFLRTSRAALDDTITQDLNTLRTPASQPFDPITRPSRKPIDPTACAHFKNTLLFPTWHSRSAALSYCAAIAASPDPSDPEHLLRAHEDAAARERVVDERLDPYSARYFPREARTEALASLIRNERSVERIIRARTWKIVGERCGDDGETGMDAERAMERWRRDHSRGAGGGV